MSKDFWQEDQEDLSSDIEDDQQQGARLPLEIDLEDYISGIDKPIPIPRRDWTVALRTYEKYVAGESTKVDTGKLSHIKAEVLKFLRDKDGLASGPELSVHLGGIPNYMESHLMYALIELWRSDLVTLWRTGHNSNQVKWALP